MNSVGTMDMPIFHPLTMAMDPREVERAQAIKIAVETDPDLQNLSDFEYLQFALVHPASESPLKTAIEQVRGLQAFKEEYKIKDTLEEAVFSLRAFAQEHPGVILDVSYVCKRGGNCALVADWGAFHPAKIQTEQQKSIFFKGMYYINQSMSPTFLAIRHGVSILLECQGTSSENVDCRFFMEVIHQLSRNYPKRHKEIYALNSPTVINVVYGLLKRYMPDNMRKAFQLGKTDPGLDESGLRLDQCYRYNNSPAPEAAARERMVKSAQTLLQIRIHHQFSFRLPKAAATMYPGPHT